MRTVLALVLLAVSMLPATAAAAQTEADKAAARQISSHLEQSGQLRNYRIGVTHEDGVVSLAGTVASAEQRDVAIRLAKQVTGVSHVICRLQFPGANESSSDSDHIDVSNAFNELNPASAQGEPSDVMHAYGENYLVNPPPAEQPSMLSLASSRINRRRQMPRSNMPLPFPRRGINPGIQQASAQNVYPAGGACPDGYCGPMGPEMGGGGAMGGGAMGGGGQMGMQAVPVGFVPQGAGRGPSYENAQMPGYAWPSYASYPNYAALSYPRQYSPTAWPYIGPFYPYPQVPLAWRKVSLEWDDGWWFLDFSSHNSSH